MARIPNVTAIGTCRIHNPLSKLDKVGEIRLNHNPANQFVHTSGEIIQRIGVLRNGDGFPRGLNKSKIGTLSCIFILSHEFAHRLLTEPITHELLESIHGDLDKNYSSGNFKKPHEALKKAFNR